MRCWAQLPRCLVQGIGVQVLQGAAERGLTGHHGGDPERIPGPLVGVGGPPSSVNPFAQCLAPHGYAQWNSFQPVTRFWPFQWIEGGWLLVLAALLIAVTIWLVHRRAA